MKIEVSKNHVLLHQLFVFALKLLALLSKDLERENRKKF